MRRYLPIALVFNVCLLVHGTMVSAGGHLCQGVPYDDQTKGIINMMAPVPPGWIIVGYRHSPDGNGLGPNAWVIQKLPTIPGAEMLIYPHQQVPPGWSAVSFEKNCYMLGHRAVRIRRL